MVLACDVHLHMRGYVVVSPTPWVQVCSREGRFRLEGVPDGHYVLNVWHEMGEPLRKEIVVSGRQGGRAPRAGAGRPDGAGRVAGRVARRRPRRGPGPRWSTGSACCSRRAGRPRRDRASGPTARRLAEDAYWAEFEASDMEVAVRRHLGYARAGELERQFLPVSARRSARSPMRHRSASVLEDRSHDLLLDLLGAARRAERQGRDRRGASRAESRRSAIAGSAPVAGPRPAGGPQADPASCSRRCGGACTASARQADRDGPDDAASELTTVYMTDFEPIERYLLGRSPQSVRPLEIRFNAVRGEITGGLKGEPLASRLEMSVCGCRGPGRPARGPAGRARSAPRSSSR